jgi:hypothetical protein
MQLSELAKDMTEKADTAYGELLQRSLYLRNCCTSEEPGTRWWRDDVDKARHMIARLRATVFKLAEAIPAAPPATKTEDTGATLSFKPDGELDWIELGKVVRSGMWGGMHVIPSFDELSAKDKGVYADAAKAVAKALGVRKVVGNPTPAMATDAEFEAWWLSLKKHSEYGPDVGFLGEGYTIRKERAKTVFRNYLNWKTKDDAAKKSTHKTLGEIVDYCATFAQTDTRVCKPHPKINTGVTCTLPELDDHRYAWSPSHKIVSVQLPGRHRHNFDLEEAERFRNDLDLAISTAKGQTTAERKEARRKPIREAYDRGYRQAMADAGAAESD